MKKICKVPGCEEKIKGNGFCRRHYNQLWKYGKILTTWFDRPRICKVDGCESKCYGKGYCHRHYQQMKISGSISRRTQKDSNEIIIDGNIAYIQLYNRKYKKNGVAIIDSEDIDKIKNYKWSKDGDGYVSAGIKNKTTRMHNLILNQKTNRKIQVDHKNRIKHDYRKSNLRLCTSSENGCNKRLLSSNTSGFRGVYFSTDKKKWIAQIKLNYKQYHLGCFVDKVEAAMARDRAAIKMHGEFATLNLPRETYYGGA